MRESSPGPPPPREVGEWMARFGSVEFDASAEGLASGAMQAFREALARPGRDRDGAFALLAADGLLTYAVEACAEEEDPEGALRRLVALVAEIGGGLRE